MGTLENEIAKAERGRARIMAQMDNLSVALDLALDDMEGWVFGGAFDPQVFGEIQNLLNLLAERAQAIMAVDLEADIRAQLEKPANEKTH